jgi:hypothetical protein
MFPDLDYSISSLASVGLRACRFAKLRASARNGGPLKNVAAIKFLGNCQYPRRRL